MASSEKMEDPTVDGPKKDVAFNADRESQPFETAETAAAELIQRNYRGYRQRRQMDGIGLDPSTRWLEAIKEARYRNATRPKPRASRPGLEPETPEAARRRSSSDARANWRRIGAIAQRAADDDTSDTEGEEGMSEEQLQIYKRKKTEAKEEREKTSKMMDLQYFLEMVDTKHRYGSNLRAYHEVWMNADTNENFFSWLDEGEGSNIELPTVSRERLDSERVRYLSREERLNYLVKINQEGRLCWARNGLRISTSLEWKDSVNGIVPRDDTTALEYQAPRRPSTLLSSSSSSVSSISGGSIEGDHYVNQDLRTAQGVKRLKQVSPATILNHLLRKTVKPNSWIFVADTSFRLYVGIKQSGGFQHSSFLQGARISAAGLIKIKDGQLRRLSPLSGHYRPPTSNFRAFVHSLEKAGVDMSHVSISRSYAVLVGLEGYVRTRKMVRQGIQNFKERKDKILRPAEARRKEEERKDKSKSAEKERRLLKAEEEQFEEKKREGRLRVRFMRKLRIGSVDLKQEPPLPPAQQAGQDTKDESPPEGG